MRTLLLLVCVGGVGAWAQVPSPQEAPFQPTTQRAARLLSEPRVEPGALVGRVGFGTLTAAAGAALGGGLVFVGILTSFSTGGIIPAVISGLFATGLLAAGNALGAALFGQHFGRDFVDAFAVGLGAALVSAVCIVAAYLFQVAAVPLLVVAALMPMSTPLWVQLSKPPADGVASGPGGGVVLASF